MKIKFILTLILGFAGLHPLVWSAPQILNYSGRITVSGQPYTGQGHFKFALVNRAGNVSYWSNEGNYTLAQEPVSAVASQVNGGVYSVNLGDSSLANMQAIPGQVFQDHNDVHLRIWFALSTSGPFDLLSPDQAVTSVPYALNGGGGSTSVSAGSGSTVQQTTVVEGGRVLTTGDLVRLVATGPANPSQTLILLAGDEVDIVTYSAGQPARLEYSFGEHTFAIPQTKDGMEIMQTLMGPGAIRLTAATGHQTLAVLRVRRTDGRAPTLLYGGESNASQPSGPAVVSLPKTRTVVRGGATTLFVSASGKNLAYQWKRNGQSLTNTPTGGSPSPGSARILGATSSSLVMSEAKAGDSGSYTVVITDPNGVSTTSTAVQLVVDSLMKNVPSGLYRLNSTPSDPGHEVYLSTYNVDMYEVKQSYWEEVYAWATVNGYDFDNPGMNTDPSGITQTGEHPIHTVSWYDAVKWANARSEKDGFTPCYYTDENRTTVYRKGQVDLTNYMVKWSANGYRLPTEAEWEVAARGGLASRRYAWGDSPFPSRANYVDTRVGKTAAIGSFPDNGYGLYDMQGNLMEWTWDRKESRTYDFDFKESAHETNVDHHDVVGGDSIFTMSKYGRSSWAWIPIPDRSDDYMSDNHGRWKNSRFDVGGGKIVLGFRATFYSSGHQLHFLDSKGQGIATNNNQSAGTKTHFNPKPEDEIVGVQVYDNYTGIRFGSYSEPVEGTAHILSEGNLSIAGSNPTVRDTGMVISSSLTPDYFNHDSYQVAKVLAVDNAKVTKVSHQIRGNNSGDKALAKIQFTYTDGTEQNSTEVTQTSNAWLAVEHNNPSPNKDVSQVKVWLSDDGTGQAYERNTVVWGEPRNESLAFTESSTASSSSSTWNMAKEIVLPISRLCTRISFNHYVSLSNIGYTNLTDKGLARMEFEYADGTESNSSITSTSYRHNESGDECSLSNPNPSKEVAKVRVWLRSEQASTVYATNITGYQSTAREYSLARTVPSDTASVFAKVREIPLTTPTLLSGVSHQVKRVGANGEAKVQFFYSDGTDANSTYVSVSQGLFTEFIHLNPQPAKTVTKLVTWLKPGSAGTVWERRMKKFGFVQESANFGRKSSHASYDTQMVKRIEFPQAVLTDGVMNQIRKVGSAVGTISCKIRFNYQDGTNTFSPEYSTLRESFETGFYQNPQSAKLVTGIEVWLRTPVNGSGESLSSEEKGTSIMHSIKKNFRQDNASYVTINIPPYDDTYTHFKVKVDATRESGDGLWFEILDGNNTKVYSESDFDKYHAVQAPINRPQKLRIIMKPVPGDTPQTGVSAIYWQTNDPKGIWSGQWSNTSRVYRGDHFDEGIREVRFRRQAGPTHVEPKLGFRLVQRP